MVDRALYAGREQTRTKHEVLKRYLQRFAHIVGSAWDTITYVDGFSGPWKSQSENFEDTSFSIAIEQFRQARATLRKRLRIRCLFLEVAPERHRELEGFAATIRDAEVETLNAPFEESVPAIVDFIRRGGRGAFPFVFVDPKGWTGYDLERISPILRLQPIEVLINFMTGHVERFVESGAPAIRKTFRGLYGNAGLQTSLAGLSGIEREDAVVREFADNLRRAGGFAYVPYAMVLRPMEDRAQFHLVYGTRSERGLEVFKEAEGKAMEEMELGRGEAKQREREAKSQTPDLFDAQTMHDPGPFERRRMWYSDRARERLGDLVTTPGGILYDDLWSALLQSPLIWEKDLKRWVAEMANARRIEILGLSPRERVVKRGRGHRIVPR